MHTPATVEKVPWEIWLRICNGLCVAPDAPYETIAQMAEKSRAAGNSRDALVKALRDAVEFYEHARITGPKVDKARAALRQAQQ